MQNSIKEFSTVETRAKALAKANLVRGQRKEVYESIKNGNTTADRILFNLDNEYEFMKRVPVKRFLKAFKGISTQKADTIIKEVGIAEGRRLQGLGKLQKTNLILAIEQYQW